MDFTFTRAVMKSKKDKPIKFESNWSKESKEFFTKSKSNSDYDYNRHTSYYFEHNLWLKCPIEMIQDGMES